MIQLLINISITFSLYLLIAVSFFVIYKPAKFFHLAHAIGITFGAYFSFLFLIQLDFPFYLAFLTAIIATVLVIYLVERILYRSFTKIDVPSWQLLVVSLGIYIVLQNVISLTWGDSVQSFRIWPIQQGIQIFNGYITLIQVLIIFLSLFLVFLCWIFIHKTSMGYKLLAVSDTKELSQIFGISPNRIISLFFLIGSGLAACAGIVIAADSNMTPTMGFNWLLYGVIAMIIGGIGKINHLIFGSLLLATSQHLTAYYLSTKWMDATAFIILIVFLAWKPYGFSGQKLRKAEI